MKKFTLSTMLILICILASCLLVACSFGGSDTNSSTGNGCNHTFGDWETVKEPTCTENGLKERSCYYCTEKISATIEATGHIWLDASSTLCSVCGNENTDASTDSSITTDSSGTTNSSENPNIPHEHVYGEWIITKEPTCTESGLKEKTCSCGDTVTEEIEATGHNFVNGCCDKCNERISVGLEYTLSADGTYYTVSGIGTCTDKELNIPSTYGGLPVTSIGNNAFFNCTSLTSVEIPSSVTSIGEKAFYYCTSLTSITIPESVTSIGGSSAFDKCTSLTSVNYLGDIEGWCNISFGTNSANPLYYAKNLYIKGELVTELVIPNTVTKIKDYAFSNYTSLTSVTIGENVTSIGSCAFSGCTSLTCITILESVTSIGSYAFLGCTSLTSITIPDSVTSIGEKAFSYCTSLTIYCEAVAQPGGWNANWAGENCQIVWGHKENDDTNPNEPHEHAYGEWVTTKEPTCTENGSKEKTCSCGDTVTEEIEATGHNYVNGFCSECGKEAASEGLKYTLSADGTYYTVSGMGTCTDTELYIPSTYKDLPVTGIGNAAFEDCSSLTSVTIPESVTSIGYGAFQYCTGLTEINFNATAMADLSSKNYVFYNAGTNGNGITVNIGSNVTKIPNYLFYPYSKAPKITSVVFEENSACTSIGSYAFYNCKSLTSVTIPESVTSIGKYAFVGCTSLTIYCEAIAQPKGWDASWAGEDCQIVWGHKENDDTNPNEPHEHAYGEWVTTKEPTCTENGSKEKVCSCGDTVTEEIEATGHSFISGYCSVCDIKDPNFVYTPSVGTTITADDWNAVMHASNYTSIATSTNGVTATTRSSETAIYINDGSEEYYLFKENGKIYMKSDEGTFDTADMGLSALYSQFFILKGYHFIAVDLNYEDLTYNEADECYTATTNSYEYTFYFSNGLLTKATILHTNNGTLETLQITNYGSTVVVVP